MKNQDETERGKRSKNADNNRRKSRKARPKPLETSLRLGRTLRTGGAFVVRESRKAYDAFNTFTQTGEIKTEKKKTAPAKPAKTRTLFSRNLNFIIFLLAVMVISSIAAMILSNASVSVDRQTVSIVGLHDDLEGYRILVVSDLHARSFGSGQTSLLRTINSINYDMVLFTGDMVGKSGNAQPFYDLLEGMNNSKPKFFVCGDSDPDPILRFAREDGESLKQMVLSDWVLGAEERGATWLDITQGISVGNATMYLSPVNDLTVNVPESLILFDEQVEQESEGSLAGLEADYEQLPMTTFRRNQLLKLDDILHDIGSDDLHIGVCHMPPSDEYLSAAVALGQTDVEYDYLPPVDLVVCGHYCAGGWKLPGYGALYVPNTFLPRHGWFPDQRLVEGLRQAGTVQVYTSPGLSVTDAIHIPNFRLANSPRITLLTLTAAITEDLLGNG